MAITDILQDTDSTTDAKRVRRDAFIQALRDCADFLDTHPTIAAPMYVVMNVFVNSREEIANHARAASWEKEYNGSWFNLKKEFGGDLRLEINADRSLVCRKVVTGTSVVPAQPEHTVETYEWVCDEPSLLGKAV